MPLDPRDEELAERGRALIASAVAETSAPVALRERIEADRSRAIERGVRPGRRRLRWLLLPAAGLVAALVVAIVVLSSSGAAPTVVGTAALAARGPVLPAPVEDASNRAVLKSSVEGVPFPYWNDSFRWKAVGARDDRIEEREAKTVYYEDAGGARAAYTILGGDAVDPPSDSRKETENGIVLWVTRHDGRRIVSWQRGRHTCVLSAPLAVPEQQLLALASWKGKGKGVPF
ncbi:MAG TPA: hypothetical protein VF257_15460 [Solirubrobacteraceae bacterium]